MNEATSPNGLIFAWSRPCQAGGRCARRSLDLAFMLAGRDRIDLCFFPILTQLASDLVNFAVTNRTRCSVLYPGGQAEKVEVSILARLCFARLFEVAETNYAGFCCMPTVVLCSDKPSHLTITAKWTIFPTRAHWAHEQSGFRAPEPCWSRRQDARRVHHRPTSCVGFVTELPAKDERNG